MTVSENTTIWEALRTSPAAVRFFKKYKMECFKCKGAKSETIAQWARFHGLNPESVVREINSLEGELEAKP